MYNRTNEWSGKMREGERLVSRYSPKFYGGDILIHRQSAYGCGSCQMLFVAFVDGYGGNEPVCWTCYVKPELECVPFMFDDTGEGPDSYRVKFNTWQDVRDHGDSVYEDDACAIFPELKDFRYAY